MTQRLEKKSLVDVAVDSLREQIVNGDLHPGESLPEGRLADAFGIARPTVREVLLRLQVEGLVEKRGRGTAHAVASISRVELSDIFTARFHLEMSGARSYPTADEARRSDVENSLERMRHRPEAGNRADEVEIDYECHRSVVALSGSNRLVEAHARIMTELRLASIMAGSLEHDYAFSNHRDFVELIKEARFDEAEAQLRNRLEVAETRIAEKIWD